MKQPPKEEVDWRSTSEQKKLLTVNLKNELKDTKGAFTPGSPEQASWHEDFFMTFVHLLSPTLAASA